MTTSTGRLMQRVEPFIRGVDLGNKISVLSRWAFLNLAFVGSNVDERTQGNALGFLKEIATQLGATENEFRRASQEESIHLDREL